MHLDVKEANLGTGLSDFSPELVALMDTGTIQCAQVNNGNALKLNFLDGHFLRRLLRAVGVDYFLALQCNSLIFLV